jgi:osmotically-inducible protein OsmY
MKKSNRTTAFLAAAVLAALVGCAETSTRESTGQYVDDTVVTTRVKTAILREPTLKSAEINVETYKGVAQLSGFVAGQAAINRAVEVARHVDGVQSVKNDMRLK